MSGKDVYESPYTRWILPALYFGQVDRMRRWQGLMADQKGLGPQESPSEVLMAEPGLQVRRYTDNPSQGPVILIVPAPIKRSFIWDIAPGFSVVKRCQQGGARVYMTDWQPPEMEQVDFGLDQYADLLISAAIGAVLDDSGSESLYLAGHSLGGTLAAIYAALHSDRLAGLILLGAPLCFGRDIGLLDAMVAAYPPAGIMTHMMGNIPGSLMSGSSWIADPISFGLARHIDMAGCKNDPELLETHRRVQRWTLEETAMARRLFEEVIEKLYRNNQFIKGELVINGVLADPGRYETPLRCVVDPRCRIVPPAAMLPFFQISAHPDKDIIWYPGDTGVALQHVGMLVGRRAHHEIWPCLLRWMEAGTRG